MIKTLFLALAIAAGAWAQVTAVKDTIVDAQNKPVTGQVMIEWGEFTTGLGVHIGAGRSFVPIEKGAFSTTLQPTDTATPPGLTYTVTYSVSNYTRNPEQWHICTTATPLKIKDAVDGTCPGGGQVPAPPSWATTTAATWATITAATWATLTQ